MTYGTHHVNTVNKNNSMQCSTRAHLHAYTRAMMSEPFWLRRGHGYRGAGAPGQTECGGDGAATRKNATNAAAAATVATAVRSCLRTSHHPSGVSEFR